MTTTFQGHETRLRMKKKGRGAFRAFHIQKLIKSVWPDRPSQVGVL